MSGKEAVLLIRLLNTIGLLLLFTSIQVQRAERKKSL